jgi:hypothetical protein
VGERRILRRCPPRAIFCLPSLLLVTSRRPPRSIPRCRLFTLQHIRCDATTKLHSVYLRCFCNVHLPQSPITPTPLRPVLAGTACRRRGTTNVIEKAFALTAQRILPYRNLEAWNTARYHQNAGKMRGRFLPKILVRKRENSTTPVVLGRNSLFLFNRDL